MTIPNNKDRLDIFTANPHKALWTIAAPMMAGFTVHAMYSIVDSIYIGRLGTDALAAAGYIGALFFIVIAFTGGLATGITATVAKAFGTRDVTRISDLASNGFGLSLLFGILLAGLGLLAGQQIIPLLGASGKSAGFAWEYMRPLWMGMPLFFLTTAIRAVINGEGDARTPMIVLVMATFINVILDPVFIFVFNLGIAGAAYATLVAQGFALIALGYVAFIRRKITARFRFVLFPDLSLLGSIFKIGLPAAGGLLVMSLGMILINRVVSEFGQATVAGYVAGSKIDMFVSLPLMGIASGAMTLVGMFAGAGRMDLVRSITLYAYRWAIISAIFFGGTVFIFSHEIIGLFVKDAVALHVGRQYLGYIVFAYPLMAVGMTSGRVLQGLGFGLPSLIITIVRVLVIGVGGAYISVYLFDASVTAVWKSFILGGFGSLILSVTWVRKRLRDTPLRRY